MLWQHYLVTHSRLNQRLMHILAVDPSDPLTPYIVSLRLLDAPFNTAAVGGTKELT